MCGIGVPLNFYPPVANEKTKDETILVDGELSERLAEFKSSDAGLQDYLDFLDKFGLKKEQSFAIGQHIYTGKHEHGRVEVVVYEGYNGQVRSCKIGLYVGEYI